MLMRRLLTPTTALIWALAIAVPAAEASPDSVAPSTTATPARMCPEVLAAGPLAVLGPYGPLGDYGPLGVHAGEPNPATACGGPISFALPGFTVGSFVTANLSLAR